MGVLGVRLSSLSGVDIVNVSVNHESAEESLESGRGIQVTDRGGWCKLRAQSQASPYGHCTSYRDLEQEQRMPRRPEASAYKR